MRRTMQRRSSSTLPIRSGGMPSISNVTKTSQLTMSQPRDSRKRASSIPRPSVTPSFNRQPYGRAQDQNVSTAVTPSRSQSAQRATTPQKNSMTPQKQPPSIKPFLKDMRNFNDKTYVKDMMCNIVNFLVEFGYPDQMVSIKELQKIDKQSFINFFNFINQFLDRNFQLAGRFSEDELIKYVKNQGYGGTLTKAALVSIGALHSTSQITGLLSWMAESARILMWDTDTEEESRTMTLERQEMDVTIAAYNAWISEDSCNYEEELTNFYKRFFQVEDGAVQKIESQVAEVVAEYKVLEQKGSQMEDLKSELKRLEHITDELLTKKAELHLRLNDSTKEEVFNLQRLEDLKQKITACQKETAELKIAAKNCKLSATEARQMKAECAKLRSEKVTITEQRAEVAELFEKREVQLANISAQSLKLTRKFHVDLMDMGLIVAEESDWQGKLGTFLKEKTDEIPKMEAKILNLIEDKERMSNKKSHLVMELKHAEMQKQRLDDGLQANKLEREELKQIFLDEKASLESALAGFSARSDSAEKRLQLELDTITKKIQETDAEMLRAEKETQQKIQLKNQQFGEHVRELKDLRNKTDEYYIKLFATFKENMRAAEERYLSSADLKHQPILPKPDF